ncbi:2-isopropylmalate synthase [Tichowtungia aerotolerans]|uniref:2-isopropylmalate synthase n=1 Tax=Tichowtungia aerotolerans TaxID=2697043 RepID=A0A6P1M8I5_9BACT|nr:2-isopropylmalate synthase [Tichowtungia aerotolerans]QHI70207.1 2-isopropylmalate synthase [Tichowtungia aerotolerans]
MKTPKYKVPESFDMPDRQWPSRTLTDSPVWCSVDLRDGNQALPDPMTPDQKREYFKMLCDIGFKHIEVGFPSASQDDFDFFRGLIEEDRVPEDVFIMGLTQCRSHLIERTFEAFKGVKQGIVHAYIATSDLHMKQVFGMDRQDTIETAVAATRQIRELADAMPESDIRYEFSPEEFTDTDPEFCLELCKAVYDAWGKATPEKPLILNLPATVERRPPNHYADMIEWFCSRFPNRDRVQISLHSHNDQGMAVAATELALMAGADRVEGTLFGHGERTGNVDLVTVVGNLFSRGIETGLDFSNMEKVVESVERLTGMPVYYRQPYAGEYAFTAFSGSHQDAINKGMHRLDKASEIFGMRWKVPYLHIDPADLGRSFERLIRINSQSGKGGIAWVLEQEYGVHIPKAMQPELREEVQRYSEEVSRELSSEEVYKIFEEKFLRPEGPYELAGYWPRPDDNDPTFIHGEVKILVNGEAKTSVADGNGPISAFVNAVRELAGIEFGVDDYHEQAIGKGADAQALAYVPLKLKDNGVIFGVGSDSNIDQAAVRAIIAGLNRIEGQQK